MNTAQIAGVGEIDESDEICRAPNPIIVLGRQIGEGRSEQSASKTIPDCVDLAHAS